MARLKIVTSNGKTKFRKLDRNAVTIGRAETNDIVLAEHTVSRKHSSIRMTSKGCLIEDLKSHNGTFVNGAKINRRMLRNNDRVKIGTATIIYLDPLAAGSSGTAPAARRAKSAEPKPKPKPRRVKKPPEPEVASVAVNDEATDQEVVASIKTDSIDSDSSLLPKMEPRHKAASKKVSVVDLEKSNKTLYVLYQISRHLNRTPDFDELLKTIMDLIFQVIDADYGFVALLGEKPGELIPKVIKYRTAPEGSQQKLKMSRAIVKKVISDKESILTSNAMDDDRFGGSKSIFLQNIRSVLCVPLFRKDDVIGMIQVDSFRLSNSFMRADLDLLTTISNQMAMVIEQANLNEKIRNQEKARNRLERFHSPEVVDFIVSGEAVEEETLMAPREKFVTMLFTDIVNFTPMSERFPASEISLLLNAYFTAMTDIIFDYNGTLDKYIGDAIMAVFGAPIERENDAERSIWAALEMRQRLFELREDFHPEQRFDIRLGINSGKVVAGNLGSPRRMDYTVIGDTVNVAARLESIAETNQILIGESTYELTKDKFKIREIGMRTVKGKKEPLRVFEVLD